jgi:serine/threonine protein phosphatase PrpC
MMKFSMCLPTAFKKLAFWRGVPEKVRTESFETPGKPTMSSTIAIDPIVFHMEKVSGAGEDAKPLLMLSDDRKFGLAAVFDGLGGSGAGRFETPTGNFTGARIAATIARDSLFRTVRNIWLNTPKSDEQQLAEPPGPREDAQTHEQAQAQTPAATPNQIADQRLPDGLVAELRKRNIGESVREAVAGKQKSEPPQGGFGAFSGIPNPPLRVFDEVILGASFDRKFSEVMGQLSDQTASSRIKSRGKRYLPTTFAAGFFAENAGKVTFKMFWAGDSRVYFLSPSGLFQLTRDHVQLKSTGTVDLHGDAPLTRVISEQVPNELECYEVADIQQSGYLIACTDGAYAYFPTAVHFELALWSALIKPTCIEQIGSLATAIGKVAQDDASIAIIPVGFDGDRQPVVPERLADLDVRYKGFEDSICALREMKAKAAKLEAEVDKMRGDMQALPRSSLAVGGESA